MPASDSTAQLCAVCSKLDVRRLIDPIYPCRNPESCTTPPIHGAHGSFLALGSIDEIKRRRATCDICRLVAERLDREPPDLDGECRIRESAQYCNFRLPGRVQARDPSVTHFHFTQVSVIFDTSVSTQFQGPSLPWELKERDTRSSHYILNFQVKARSCVEAGNPSTASPRTEQEFLDTVGGRYVSTQVNTQLVRAWLRQCESKHGKDCTTTLRLPVGRDREPTFVVDVIQWCLVDTPLQCRYVALSYVWGTAPVFVHLLGNTREIRKTNALRSLPIPATISDAVILVHAIGERYLWVDSLCIIQDDLGMKQAEIMRMGSVYSKALFTIIAAAGDHANSGLPGIKRGSREQVQEILKLADCVLLTVIDVRKTPSGIDDTVWAQRAWTFQERVLSNRVLVFSENQVYWSCRTASHAEERALEQAQDIDRLHLSFPQKTAADCLSWESLQSLEYCNMYDDLLSIYRQRRLTYQTDLLNAFNGVSEVLAGIQGDTILWGLPESLFSYAMTWSFTGYSSRNYVEVPTFDSNGSKEMVPIPSWSWAAWSFPDFDYPPFLHAGDSTHVRPLIQFDIVDGKHQLVRIKERSWEGHPGGDVSTSWKSAQPHQASSLAQQPILKMGQLRFWTSLANVRAVRRWRFQGLGQVQYTLFPPPDFQPDPNGTHYRTELVQQDFVVIAARGPKMLILLAIEWEDGVAYRVGKTDVEEKEWVKVEEKEWRLITLG